MLSTQPYKGTRDFYPPEMRMRRWMFNQMKSCVESFAFEEYDGPMLEPFELYAAKTGEEIVNQQLYWMMDRGERKMAVRPEMTPTLARMVAGQFHELPKPVRWYSIPNLWRYERPQKGRLREHWQLNVDILGGDALLADAEILRVALNLLKRFGAEGRGLIKINHRKLMDTFFQNKLGLSPEVALKITKAVDARDKIGEEKYNAWLNEVGLTDAQKSAIDRFFKSDFETISKDVGGPGVEALQQLFSLLGTNGKGSKDIQFDPLIMRGMDYYTGTVFEMFDRSPENRRALFGGGRYDNLIGLFGKNQLSGVGFGLGDVTFIDFLTTHKLLPPIQSGVDVMITLIDSKFLQTVENLAEELRRTGLKIMTPLTVSGFSDQLKAASKHGARFVVLIGETEVKTQKWTVKELATGNQVSVTTPELTQLICRSSNSLSGSHHGT